MFTAKTTQPQTILGDNTRFCLERTSKKRSCPSCKQKTYKCYIDTENQVNFDYDIGRCDRENTCKYHKTPKTFFEENPDKKPNGTKTQPNPKPHALLRPFGLPTQDTSPIQMNRQNPTFGYQPDLFAKEQAFPAPIGQFNQSTKEEHLAHNALVIALMDIFEHQAVWDTIKLYKGGTAKMGAFAYWYVNHNDVVLNCKVIHYNGLKRNKALEPLWKYTAAYGYGRCLYGIHLVPQQPNALVYIHESEKSALVCQIAQWPHAGIVHIAKGGASMLNYERALPLRNRNVVLVLDCDDAGRKRAEHDFKILNAARANVQILDIAPNRSDGYDAADMILEAYTAIPPNEPQKVEPMPTDSFFYPNMEPTPFDDIN
jgi:hypothetical protein